MTLYLIGFINGIMVFSFAFISYKGYEFFNKQIKYNYELEEFKKKFNDIINEDKIITDNTYYELK